MHQHVHAIVQGAVVCDDNVYGIVHVIFVFGLFWNSRDFFNLSNDGMLAAVIVLIGDIARMVSRMCACGFGGSLWSKWTAMSAIMPLSTKVV